MSVAYHNNNTVSFLEYTWENINLIKCDKRYRICLHTNYPHKQETNEEYLMRLLNKVKQFKQINNAREREQTKN